MFKTKNLLLIVVVLVLLLGLVLVLSMGDKDEASNNESVGEGGMSSGGGSLPSNLDNIENDLDDQPTVVDDEFDDDYVDPRGAIDEVDIENKKKENLAIFFIEKIGTYSKETNFRNVVDLKPYMTLEMQSWADDFVRRNRNFDNEERFFTEVVNIDSLGSSSDRAVWLLQTRRENESEGKKDTYNQDVVLEMVYSNSNWKVSNITWK